MVAKTIALLLSIAVVLESYQAEAWIFRRIFRRNDRNCFCKVVDADTYRVIHNFGSVQKCSGWPTCGCRRHEMITCGDRCDQVVRGWLSSNSSKCSGRFIKKHYQASTCSQAYGHERIKC